VLKTNSTSNISEAFSSFRNYSDIEFLDLPKEGGNEIYNRKICFSPVWKLISNMAKSKNFTFYTIISK